MSEDDRTGQVWEASAFNGTLKLLFLVVGPGEKGSQRIVCLEGDPGALESSVQDKHLEEGQEANGLIRWSRFA